MAEKTYLGGVTHTTLHQEEDGTTVIEEKQDCEPIMDYAAAGRNARFSADSCDGMLRHEAEIPAVIFLEECRKRGVTPFSKESDLVMEWIIANPDYAKFRAAPTVRDARIIVKGSR